ncbi:MAG: hypothetical protein JKY42_05315 [Flavobacteriales bacterium]|nr:hypothetical protein [Flavobacteriales bacterium]
MRVSLILLIILMSVPFSYAQNKLNVGLDLGYSLVRSSVAPVVKYGRFEIYSGLNSYYLNPNKLNRRVFGYHFGGNYYFWKRYCKYYVGVSYYKMKYLYSNQEAYNFNYDVNLLYTTPRALRVDYNSYNLTLGANWPLGKNFFVNLELGWTHARQLSQKVHDEYSTCELGFCSDIDLIVIDYNIPFFKTGIRYYFGSKLEHKIEQE